MVSCYAPQTGRSQIEEEEFWRQVEGVIMNTDINQEVIVGGDMNGHVGQVANGFHEAHGNFGYGTRNAGERILVCRGNGIGCHQHCLRKDRVT